VALQSLLYIVSVTGACVDRQEQAELRLARKLPGKTLEVIQPDIKAAWQCQSNSEYDDIEERCERLSKQSPSAVPQRIDMCK